MAASRAFAALAALAAAAGLFVVAAPQTCPDPRICLQTELAADGAKLAVTISTQITNGWTAFGVGSSMSSADIMMVWRNAGGDGWTASHRYASAHETPAAAPAGSAWTLVNATAQPDAQGFFHILTTRPVAATTARDKAVAAGPGSWLIAAYQGQVNPAALREHNYVFRPFTYDALAASPPPPKGDDPAPPPPPVAVAPVEVPQGPFPRETALQVHAVCMALSWTVLAQIAVFTARFLKNKLRARWFTIHRSLFALVFVLTVIGLSMILATQPAGQSVVGSKHGKVGIFLVVAMCAQTVLGVVIDKLFDPQRGAAAPARDKAHWVLGWLLMLVGPWTAFWGHERLGTPDALVAVNATVVALWAAACVWAQLAWGQAHEAQFNGVQAPAVTKQSTAGNNASSMDDSSNSHATGV